MKNIEYEPNQNLLISSGFDGSVFAWTLNASTENANLYKQIFHTAGRKVGSNICKDVSVSA